MPNLSVPAAGEAMPAAKMTKAQLVAAVEALRAEIAELRAERALYEAAKGRQDGKIEAAAISPAPAAERPPWTPKPPCIGMPLLWDGRTGERLRTSR